MDLNGTVDEWEALSKEFQTLETDQKEYLKKSDELNEIQAKCFKAISHQKYRLAQIQKSVKSVDASNKKAGYGPDEEYKEQRERLETGMLRRNGQLEEMLETLPRKNGLYLRIILGNVNVSLTNKSDRYLYKEDYEKFKIIITGIMVALSFITLWMPEDIRFLDAAYMFLQVWYFCTLTIRESILKVNGSRIKGWWRTNHFISTATAGVLLIWPAGLMYEMFRKQFLMFNLYIAFLQFLQFRYQKGCLYRLRALGERHKMDITIEGFHSWMWKGLSFLLPFLFLGYGLQLYNAYILYQLSQHPSCVEWQVGVLSAMFFVLFFGNTLTTLLVVREKFVENLDYRFPSLLSRRKCDRKSKPKPGEGASSDDEHQQAVPADRPKEQ